MCFFRLTTGITHGCLQLMYKGLNVHTCMLMCVKVAIIAHTRILYAYMLMCESCYLTHICMYILYAYMLMCAKVAIIAHTHMYILCGYMLMRGSRYNSSHTHISTYCISFVDILFELQIAATSPRKEPVLHEHM